MFLQYKVYLMIVFSRFFLIIKISPLYTYCNMWSSQSTIIMIDINTANQRLDRFLRKYFRQYPDISLVMIFKAIRTWQIKINGKKCDQSTKLIEKDTLTFHQSFLDLLNNKNPASKKTHQVEKQKETTISLDTFQSRIISEDDDRLVINKPAGISIHPWQKVVNSKSWVISWDKKLNTYNSTLPTSLHDLIKQYYSSRGFAWSMFQPNVAYRLDKDTSWLVIVAKTYTWLQYLNEQIREHKVDKMYYAIVIGTFPKQLTCNKPLKKIVDKQFWRGKMIVTNPSDPDAQIAHTIGYVEKTRSDPILWPLSLVKVKITTGRMHQIRVHFADAGYPILGDIVYGLPSYNRKLQKNHNILRQCLHCFQYSFTDQNSQNLSFQAPLLDDMKKLIP